MKKTIITLAMCMMFILPGCINSDNETANIFHGDIISDARPISDFTLLTSDNTSYDFKENTKGKVTVIDFWAAWCGPCRRENPNVVRIYDKYHDKGLEIIGVSLDGQSRQKDPKKAWLDAIEKDGLKWHQVSHLKYQAFQEKT